MEVPGVAPPSGSVEHSVGPFYGREAAAALLGVTSRQAVDRRRASHQVLGVRSADRMWLYPTFQWTGSRDGYTLLPGLLDVLPLLVTPAAGWAAARWLRTPNRVLDGRRPEQWLADGPGFAVVLDAARRHAELWDSSTRV